MRGYLSRLKKAVKGETKKSKKEDKDEDSFGEHSQDGGSQDDQHHRDRNSGYLDDDDDECAGVSRISLDLELDLDMKVFGEHIAGDFPPSPQLQHHGKNHTRNCNSTPNSNHAPSYQAPRPLSFGMEIGGGEMSKHSTLGRSISDTYDEDLDDLLDEELDKLSDNEDIDSVESAHGQIIGGVKTDGIVTRAHDDVHSNTYIEHTDDMYSVHEKSFDGCDTKLLVDTPKNPNVLESFKVEGEDGHSEAEDSESSHSLNQSSHTNGKIELNGIGNVERVPELGEEDGRVKPVLDQQDERSSREGSSLSHMVGDSESTAGNKPNCSEPDTITGITLIDSSKENEEVMFGHKEYSGNERLGEEISKPDMTEQVDKDARKGDQCSEEAEANAHRKGSPVASDPVNEEFDNTEGDKGIKRDDSAGNIASKDNDKQIVNDMDLEGEVRASSNADVQVIPIERKENLVEEATSSERVTEGNIGEKGECVSDENRSSENIRDDSHGIIPVQEQEVAETKAYVGEIARADVEREATSEGSSDALKKEEREETTGEKQSKEELIPSDTHSSDIAQPLELAGHKTDEGCHNVVTEAEVTEGHLDDEGKDTVKEMVKPPEDTGRLKGDENKCEELSNQSDTDMQVGENELGENENSKDHGVISVGKRLSGEETEIEMSVSSVCVEGNGNAEGAENASKEMSLDEVDRADDSIRSASVGSDDVSESGSKKNRSNRGSLCQTESDSDDEFDSAQEEFSEDEVKEAINENYGTRIPGDPETLHLSLDKVVLGPTIGESSTDNVTDGVTSDSETSSPNYIDATEDFSALIGSVDEGEKGIQKVESSEKQDWKNEVGKESLEVVKDCGYYSLPMSPKLSETSRNNQQAQIRSKGSGKSHDDDDDGDSLASSEGVHTSSRANSVSVELNSSTDSTYSSQLSDGAEEQADPAKLNKVNVDNTDSIRKALEKRSERLHRTVSRSKSNDASILDSSCASDKGTASSSSLSQESPSSERSKLLYGSPGEGMLVHIVHGAHSEAEARLAQRRAARAEARELRLRELEKQQKDQDTEEEKQYANTYSAEPATPPRSNLSSRASVGRTTNSIGQYSRRSSEDSTNDDSLPASARELRVELKELDEKFRKAMITNAQLDNEKSTLTYEVELYKDRFMDLEEQYTQLTKEHKKKCSEFEQLKRVSAKLQEENQLVRRLLEEKDELIQEYGLVIVGEEEGEGSEEDEDTDDLRPRKLNDAKKALLSQEAAELLAKGAAHGSLDLRLRKLAEDKNELEDQVRRLKMELEEEHCKSRKRRENGLDFEKQKEANKTVNEYKFRVQKAEAEVSTLQANVARLEALVTRYKAQAEELEKSEEELKVEKRKLQRELRDNQSRLEEIETTNSHLQKRFDKLKTARSTLLKDLSQDPA